MAKQTPRDDVDPVAAEIAAESAVDEEWQELGELDQFAFDVGRFFGMLQRGLAYAAEQDIRHEGTILDGKDEENSDDEEE